MVADTKTYGKASMGICGEGGCEQAHVWAVDGAARCRASPPGGGEARQTGVAHGGAADSVVVWD